MPPADQHPDDSLISASIGSRTSLLQRELDKFLGHQGRVYLGSEPCSSFPLRFIPDAKQNETVANHPISSTPILPFIDFEMGENLPERTL